MENPRLKWQFYITYRNRENGEKHGKGNFNDEEKETGRRKKKHSCNKICYGDSVRKYELMKRK